MESLCCLYDLGAFVPGRAWGSQWAIAPARPEEATNGQFHGGPGTAWAIHGRTTVLGYREEGKVECAGRAWQLQVHLAPLEYLWRTDGTQVPEDVITDRHLE